MQRHPGDPITYEQLIAQGNEPRDIRRAVYQGVLIRMRQGIFVTADVHAAAAEDPRTFHALEIQCLLLAMSRRNVAAAGTSAARIHGIELLHDPGPTMVVCSDDPEIGGTHRDGYFLRAADLPGAHVELRYRTPVTTTARTVVDLAGELTFTGGLVVAESALRKRLVTSEQCSEVLEWAVGRAGVVQAREVLAFADPATESVLETVSRATMRELRIPMPRCQSKLVVDGVPMWLDFDWAPELDLAGEADGFEKYLPNGGTDRAATLRALQDEKARERRIYTARGELVRWGWREANDARLLGALLEPALARARRRGRRAG